ncbi:MAG: hypothetical protein Q8880_06700 [Bacteroidota bacterium]|nr:hypothetical protein [Bacteroidota bacterium]
MKIRLIVFSIIFGTTLSCIAQNIKESMNIGDEAYNDGDYYSASIYYKKALQQDSTKLNIAYKYAESCRMFLDYKEAEKYYQFITDNDTKKEYPQSLFWLAMMSKNNAKYSNALEYFRSYFEQHQKDDNYYTKKSKNEITACEFALKAIKDTVPIVITHMGNNINTPYSEMAAVQLGDSILQFSSIRMEGNTFEKDENVFIPNLHLSKIYESVRGNNEWQKATKLEDEFNNTKYHAANGTLTSDGKKFFFNLCTIDPKKSMCDIYYTLKKENKWATPIRLSDIVNLKGYTNSQPNLVPLGDGREILYFTSDRPGGVGNLDIWYSVISETGSCSDPINLGPNINTIDDEISPFYDIKNKTLYFSSSGHNGFGGFDIFKSQGQLNKWTEAVNLGYPLNTSYNDMYYTINNNDPNSGYITSNRTGSYFIKGETCCNDIYSYKWIIPQVAKKEEPEKKFQENVKEIAQNKPQETTKIKEKTEIIAKSTPKDIQSLRKTIKEFLPLTLYFHNDEPDPKTRAVKTNLNYKQTLENYINLKNKYKEEYSSGLNNKEKIKAQQDIEDFFDDYVINGMNKLESFTSLLLQDLQSGNSITLTIKGFCSPLTTNDYNINLAKRRISSIENYLKEYNNGIFMEYINNKTDKGGKLEFYEEPLGEETASKKVSDNPNDERNSVYSVGAALERKIQIISYAPKTNRPLKTIKTDVVYMIQFASSSNQYADKELKEKFKINENIFVYKSGNSYKFMTGNFKTYKDAIDFNIKFKSRNNVESFVVAFKEGKPINIREAIQITKENEK